MSVHPPGDPQMAQRLRAALGMAADQLTPSDRLPHIQAAVASAPTRRGGIPAWVLPLAASFLVLAVGLGTFALLRPPAAAGTITTQGTGVAADPADRTVVVAENLPAPSRAVGAAATTDSSGTAKRFEWSAPVYYAAPGTSVHPWLLYRDFVRTTMGDDGLEARVTTAVNLAIASPDVWGPAMPGQDSYLTAWAPGTRVTATVSADAITLVLGAPGVDGLDLPAQRQAVQALVWTATAAAQRNVPVKISVAGGGPVVGGIPAGVFRRPTDATTELAPVWITSPGRFASVWDSRVVVEGQACTFEGTVQWELRQGDVVVSKGFATATSGCPQRGTWKVDLGVLTPGRYTIRAFDLDAASGALSAEQSVAFTVR